MKFLSRGFKYSSELPVGRYGKEVIDKLLKSAWVDESDKEVIRQFVRENPFATVVISRVPHPRLGYLGMESTRALFYPNPPGTFAHASFEMFWEI